MAEPLVFPPNPVDGNQYTLSNGIVYIYTKEDDAELGKYTSLGATTITGENADVGATPPDNPRTGRIWYDTSVQKLKIYINGNWKEFNPSA